MLKVFFGAGPSGFAEAQAERTGALAEQFAAVRDDVDRRGLVLPPGRRLVLDSGIEFHPWWVER